MSRANGSAGSADVVLLVRNKGEVFLEKNPMTISNSSSYIAPENKLITINEYADFKWRVVAVSDNSSQVTAEINGYLVDNE